MGLHERNELQNNSKFARICAIYACVYRYL